MGSKKLPIRIEIPIEIAEALLALAAKIRDPSSGESRP
jgi:hypothetical protein